MTWNYRIVRYRDGSGFGLHEVYYDDTDEPWTMTENPVGFCADAEEGWAGIIESLTTACKDAFEREVFDEPEIWPGKAP